MLTSKNLGNRSGIYYEVIREHLEDHEKGEFREQRTPGFYCLLEEKNRLQQENAQLRKECGDFRQKETDKAYRLNKENAILRQRLSAIKSAFQLRE